VHGIAVLQAGTKYAYQIAVGIILFHTVVDRDQQLIVTGDTERLTGWFDRPRLLDLPAVRVDPADGVGVQAAAAVQHEQPSRCRTANHRLEPFFGAEVAQQLHGSDVVEDQRPSGGVVRLRVIALSYSRIAATWQRREGPRG